MPARTKLRTTYGKTFTLLRNPAGTENPRHTETWRDPEGNAWVSPTLSFAAPIQPQGEGLKNYEEALAYAQKLRGRIPSVKDFEALRDRVFLTPHSSILRNMFSELDAQALFPAFRDGMVWTSSDAATPFFKQTAKNIWSASRSDWSPHLSAAASLSSKLSVIVLIPASGFRR